MYGVDISEICIISKAKSPVAAVLVDKSGERGIVAYSDTNLYQSTNSLPETLPANTQLNFTLNPDGRGFADAGCGSALPGRGPGA